LLISRLSVRSRQGSPNKIRGLGNNSLNPFFFVLTNIATMLPLLDKKQGKKQVTGKRARHGFGSFGVGENGASGGVGQRLRNQYRIFPFLDEK
ncbi:MAG TPA: hypothetical protein PLF58_11980, partial [Smithella sp.]|nr:hypothetical protein [Smithella sp.]